MSKRYSDLPFILLLMICFSTASFEKILGGGVPSWFLSQFKGSLLDLFPLSLALSFYFIAILELSSLILLTVGVVRGEFFPEKDRKDFLRAGLVLSQLTFALLAFGQRLTHKYDDAAQLFAYAALTYLASNFLLKTPKAVHERA